MGDAVLLIDGARCWVGSLCRWMKWMDCRWCVVGSVMNFLIASDVMSAAPFRQTQNAFLPHERQSLDVWSMASVFFFRSSIRIHVGLQACICSRKQCICVSKSTPNTVGSEKLIDPETDLLVIWKGLRADKNDSRIRKRPSTYCAINHDGKIAINSGQCINQE
jgi:hypothetical protein